jgi:hypothetical protein
MRSILDTTNQELLSLIKKFHSLSVDFRSLNQLRNQLQALNLPEVEMETYQIQRDRVFRDGSAFTQVEGELMNLITVSASFLIYADLRREI